MKCGIPLRSVVAQLPGTLLSSVHLEYGISQIYSGFSREQFEHTGTEFVAKVRSVLWSATFAQIHQERHGGRERLRFGQISADSDLVARGESFDKCQNIRIPNEVAYPQRWDNLGQWCSTMDRTG